MKILLIHQYFLQDGEGGGARWNEMTKYWVGEGHEVTVLAGTGHYMGNRKSRFNGRLSCRMTNQDDVTVWWCRTTLFKHGGFLGRIANYSSFLISAVITGVFRCRGAYDIIVASSPPLLIALVAIILSKIKRIRFVFEVRDIWPDAAVDMGLLKNPLSLKLALFLESQAYDRASLINVLTPAFRDVLVKSKRVCSDKICFIPNAANFELADEIHEDFDVRRFRSAHDLSDRFVLCYVGAHSAANDLRQLIQAAERLRDSSVLFVLIGDGVQKEILMRMVKERRLNNIRFYDVLPRHDVFRFLLASDAGVAVLAKNPSFKTVYSNKTFDYFACRKPTIMVIDGVSRELVEKAGAGLYAEPEDTDALVEQIGYLMQYPEMARQMGENGYVYAKAYFDRKKLASRYLHFIRQIADL